MPQRGHGEYPHPIHHITIGALNPRALLLQQLKCTLLGAFIIQQNTCYIRLDAGTPHSPPMPFGTRKYGPPMTSNPYWTILASFMHHAAQ
jgi:hypothetical protein